MENIGFHDKLDDLIPGDDATLAEWIAFAKEAFTESPCVVEHLEDLADRDGRLYRVGFSTKDFFLYLDAYKFGVETERAKWNFYLEAS
jgi:hypothetical protein